MNVSGDIGANVSKEVDRDALEVYGKNFEERCGSNLSECNRQCWYDCWQEC